MSTTGRCYCGQVRYRIDGEPKFVCVCHCESCRRASGAACVPWLTLAESQWVPTAGQLKTVESTPGVVRGFCSDCGTQLTYRYAQRAGQVDVTLASLDDPNAFAPTCHIWVQDRLPWLQLDDGLPQYPTTVGAGSTN